MRFLLFLLLLCSLAFSAIIPHDDLYNFNSLDFDPKKSAYECVYKAVGIAWQYRRAGQPEMLAREIKKGHRYIEKCMAEVAKLNPNVKAREKDLVETYYAIYVDFLS